MGVVLTSRTVAAGVLVAAFTASPAAAGEGESLDAALLRAAPQVFRALKGRGCRSVGVLKFRVKKGDEAVIDHVGTLNDHLLQALTRA